MQSLTDYEVICVNDGSSDTRGAFLEAWASEDRRVRVLHQPTNLGAGAARNRAMAVAEGKTLCFADPDDTLPHDSLEVRYRAFVDIPRLSGAVIANSPPTVPPSSANACPPGWRVSCVRDTALMPWSIIIFWPGTGHGSFRRLWFAPTASAMPKALRRPKILNFWCSCFFMLNPACACPISSTTGSCARDQPPTEYLTIYIILTTWILRNHLPPGQGPSTTKNMETCTPMKR